MAYIFLPPRTTNFFPTDQPYLAGLRGLRGLGDGYASDTTTSGQIKLAAYNGAMDAYNADLAKWQTEKAAYDKAILAYKLAALKINQDYTAAAAKYKKDLAAWNTEATAYQIALNNWQVSFANYKRTNTARSQTIASSYGLSLPQSYYDAGACLTQAQHDAYAAQCTTVRGLGSSSTDCGMKQLPVCQFGPMPTLRAQPTAPTKGALPSQPTLRAQPTEPVKPTLPPASTTPSDGGGSSLVPDNSTPLTPQPTAQPKQAGMLMNGLIIVAVLGGGYLVWRTIKKPKAQAA